MNIWITGFNLSVDTVIQIKNSDKYNRIHAIQWKSIGSKGGNVFRSLIKLGICPHLIGFIWGKTGEFIKNLAHTLCDNPLHLHLFHFYEEESRINIIELRHQKEVLISAHSPNITPLHIKFLDSLKSKINAEKDILIITGSFPKKMQVKDMLPIAKLFKQENIFVDLKGKHLIETYKYLPYATYKVNHLENNDFMEKNIIPNRIIITSATSIKASIDNIHLVIEVPTVKTINTIGAGDVFMASLVFEKMVLKKDWEESIKYAAARATASTKTIGVSEWNEEEIKKLVEAIVVYHP